MNPFWLALGIGGTALQVAVIYRMIQGFHRRYPGVFFYLLVLFLTSVIDSAAAFDATGWGTAYRQHYVFNNIARHLAGLVAVLSLYFRATWNHRKRFLLRFEVLLLVVCVAGVSLYFNYHGSLDSDYIAKAGRDLSFLTALLNLVLWFALIQSRSRERVLFLVSGGLGLNMAGEAVGQSLNAISWNLWLLASLIGVGSHILCLLIWLRAMKVYSLEQAAAAQAEAR